MRARKRFGQNFLHDASVIDAIIEMMHLKKDDILVEIGPGHGALTKKLQPRVHFLHAIEIDRDLISSLQSYFKNVENFQLYEADALKFNFETIAASFRLVGNLPYNISTPLLFHLYQFAPRIEDITVMLQKEVVDRMGAPPSSKAYGRLSVMTQYHCRIGRTLHVSPEAFVPKPKVDSAVICLKPFDTLPCKATDYQLFAKLVTVAFSQRRKQLKNSLSEFITDVQLKSLNIDPSKRPEDVSLHEYVTIANVISA